MKAHTMLDRLSSWLGTPVCAAPLSSARILRPYLLERTGIPTSGTALLFAIPYLVTSDVTDTERNLSLYAVPRDYHGYVAALGKTLIPFLQQSFPDYRFALFSDHSPLDEVPLAARAGMGVVGQNRLLITPEYGSFVFLAEVCTDADYEAVTGQPTPNIPKEPPTCEGCGVCLSACPARRAGRWISPCLSELTQKKGDLTPAEMTALRDHALVWGCDTCQTVCPHNRAVIAAGRDTPTPYFREARLTRLHTASLDAMDDPSFATRAFAWRGRAVIRRNLMLKEEIP